MPIRKLSIFSSNASIISRQSSERGTRPPTYASDASVSVTQAFNELNLTGYYDRESIRTVGHAEVLSTTAPSISEGAVTPVFDLKHRPSGPRYSELFVHRRVHD